MEDLLDNIDKQPKSKRKLIIAFSILNLIAILGTVGLAYIEVETIIVSFFILGTLAILLLIFCAKSYNLGGILFGIANLFYPGGMTALIITQSLSPRAAHSPVVIFGLGACVASSILFVLTILSERKKHKNFT